MQKRNMKMWQESDQEKNLRMLATFYHECCEAYDRRVCTGGISPRSGDVLPADSYEYRLINRHAGRVRDIVLAEGAALGLTIELIYTAIQEHT